MSDSQIPIFPETGPPVEDIPSDAGALWASVSGGRDSTAMVLHLADRGLPFRAVHMDTGWEHEATVAYVRGPLADLVKSVTGHELTIVGDEVVLTEAQEAAAQEVEEILGHRSAFVRRVLNKGIFPSRTVRFCTQKLKIFPARDLCRAQTGPVCNVQGVRAAESVARSKYPVFEPNDGDSAVWRPLLRWSAADVADIHRRHGVAWNPLYDMGAGRVGCWPCIFASREELRLIGQDDRRLRAIRALERHVAAFAVERHQAKGQQLKTMPALFMAYYRPDRTVRNGMWPIDMAVEWAAATTPADLRAFASKHGLRAARPPAGELFATNDEGCGRQSACEPPTTGGES